MPTLDPLIVAQADALLDGEPNPITVLANASALIYNAMPHLNWAGFYLYSAAAESLDLGPFQGQVACTHIAPGRGVVGTSFAEQKPVVVPDVHAFAGHIACDAASNSEIVIPLMVNGAPIGVLDIDSPELDRFSATDAETLTAFAAAVAKHLDVARLQTIY